MANAFRVDRTSIRSATLDTALMTVSLIAVVLLGYFLLGTTGERVAGLFLINIAAVVSLTVFMGFSGVMTFGHVGFMGLGAYVGAYLTLPPALKGQFLPGLPDWLVAVQMPVELALPIAFVAVALVALAIGPVVCRMPTETAPIATIGILVIVHGLIVGAKDLTRGIQPLFGFTPLTGVAVPLLYAVFCIALAAFFRASPTGLRLQASRENELSAAASGVDVARARLFAWVLSAAMIAGAGVLLGHHLTVISPKKFYFIDMFALLAMGIIGGISTISGALAGATLVTLLSEITRRIEGASWLAEIGLPPLFGLTQVVLALAILTVMYRRPSGLIPWRELTQRIPLPRPLMQPPATAAAVIPAPRLTSLSVERVSKSFDGLKALDDVSFRVAPGETLGLIGPNGSGKTTLVNVISGVLESDGGTVRLGDADISNLPPHDIAAAGVARTFQNIRLFENLSVAENVRVAALTQGGDADAVTARALEELDLLGVADLPAGSLAYGVRRRVEIARALSLRAPVILLDEPTAGMNEAETADLARRLKALKARHGLSLLVIEHDQAFVQSICDRIIVLNQGKLIAEGLPEDVKKNPLVIEAYLGRRAVGEPSADIKGD